MRYHATLTIRNGYMKQAMAAAGIKTAAALARAVGVYPSVIGEYLNLKRAAWNPKRGQYTEISKRIAKVLWVTPEELWPHDEMMILKDNRIEGYSDKAQLTGLSERRQLTPFEEVAEAERTDLGQLAVSLTEDLPEKYRKVLQLRHLEGLPFPDICKIMGIRSTQGCCDTYQRATKALRKLVEEKTRPNPRTHPHWRRKDFRSDGTVQYNMRAVWDGGEGHTWTVMGLYSYGDSSGNLSLGIRTKADTTQSILAGIGAALTSRYQLEGILKKGDIIVAPPQSLFSGGKRLLVPAQQWKCEDTHVAADNYACKQAIRRERSRNDKVAERELQRASGEPRRRFVKTVTAREATKADREREEALCREQIRADTLRFLKKRDEERDRLRAERALIPHFLARPERA